MNAHRLRRDSRPHASNAFHSPGLYHIQRLRQRLLFVVNQRARLHARHQATVGLIAAIGKHLLPRHQTIAFTGPDQLASRQSNQYQ